MNKELLERTIKNRRIELSEQEKKDYFATKHLFSFFFTPVILWVILAIAKFKGEIIDTEFIWFSALFPIISISVLYLTYWNKRKTLKLHYINTVLTPEEQQKVLLRLAKENRWKVILCNKQQFVADDICFRWHVRVVAIFGSPKMAYNSRCNPNYYRYHASGGRNYDNREVISKAIEKEWMNLKKK